MTAVMTGRADAADGGADTAPSIGALRRLYAELMDIEKHYRRKEHLLFSCLERHGITGPSKVMWGKDDEIRGLLKALGAGLRKDAVTGDEWRAIATKVAEPALAAVEEMIFKEERILLPMAMQNLSETEWEETWSQSPQFGYCLAKPGKGYTPPQAANDVPEAARAEAARAGVTFAPGQGSKLRPMADLSPRPAEPVDLTLVGADDRVKFFSEGKNRVFASSLTIVGRLVHIRYFALRDGQQAYLGCVEVTQDLTRERKLEGERRLLQYA